MSTSLDKFTLTLFKRDRKAPSAVPPGGRIKIAPGRQPDDATHWNNVFVVVEATRLTDVAKVVTEANRRNQLRALFVRYDVKPEWLPQMFEWAHLRTMRNTFFHSDFQMPWRMLRAWQAGAQEELIANAGVVGNELFVVSCEPETYRVPFASISALKAMPQGERSDFRLAEDGSYLHWPGPDIHLDLDALLSAIQPERRARAEKVKRAHGKLYGEAIARLRFETGLRQGDIAGLSEREVRRIESTGQVTIDSLRKLAAAHQMKLSEYLDRLAELTHTHAITKVADRTAAYKISKRK